MIRVFATVLGVLAFGVAAAGLASRYLPIGNEGVLVVAAASPYLAVAGLVAMILFVGARQWVLTILAAVLCLVMVGVQLPRYIGPEKPRVPGVAVRVVTANLGLGEADPLAVVDAGPGVGRCAGPTGDDTRGGEGDVVGGPGRRVPAPGHRPPSAGGGRRGVEPISDRRSPATSTATRCRC